MADKFFEKFMRCAKVCGHFFLDADWLDRRTPITLTTNLHNNGTSWFLRLWLWELVLWVDKFLRHHLCMPLIFAATAHFTCLFEPSWGTTTLWCCWCCICCTRGAVWIVFAVGYPTVTVQVSTNTLTFCITVHYIDNAKTNDTPIFLEASINFIMTSDRLYSEYGEPISWYLTEIKGKLLLSTYDQW